MTDQQTYTNRHIQTGVLKSLGSGVDFDGWGFGASKDQKRLMTVGVEYAVETDRTNTVAGVAELVPGPTPDAPGTLRWLWRDSDQDLERKHAEMVAGFARRDEEQWAANHDDWAAREAALPGPLRRRLERFRANGGHAFEVKGWGYELVVCELAALYATSEQADSEEVMAYARLHGTSGNQHDFAKALSRHLNDELEDQDMVANSVSALSPITGDADYSKAGQ